MSSYLNNNSHQPIIDYFPIIANISCFIAYLLKSDMNPWNYLVQYFKSQ